MTAKLTLNLPNFKARQHQQRLWTYLEGGGKRAIPICHRRWGKDEVCLHYTATQLIQRPATYWYLLPEQTQGRRVIWEAVNPHTGKRRIDEAFPPDLRATTRENEMTIRMKSGGMWHVAGSDNFDSLVGSPPLGVVFSEWSQAKQSAWAYLSPILVENGGWAVFPTTPRGRNHAWTMLQAAKDDTDWFWQVSKADETSVFSREQLQKELGGYCANFGVELGTALFQQEYLCSFESAVKGSYFGAEIIRAEEESRITTGPIKPLPNVPVDTCWDIGVSQDGLTAIWWFQVTASRIIWLDYYERADKGIEHFAEVKRRKGAERGFSYVGGTDYVPHDAKQRSWTSTGIDGTARQRLEVMRDCKLNPALIPQHGVADGIEAARRTIERSIFDGIYCADGIDCLRNYQRLYDSDLKTYSNVPYKNWATHGADSYRYGAMAWRGLMVKPVQPEKSTFVVSANPVTGTMRTGISFDQIRDRSTKKDDKHILPASTVMADARTFNQLRDRNAKLRRARA